MTIYDQLLQFPLFQGMSHADLMEVVTHTKLGFLKMEQGKVVVSEGDAATHLYFLIGGTLECETVSDDHSCRVVERITAPYAIQPEYLFGFSQRYPTTFRTTAECHFITIDKQEVFLLLETQLVFRINMVNLLSTDIQRLRRHVWRTVPPTLHDRLVRFFLTRCLYPAGSKTFFVLMSQLAAEVNDSRLNVSRTLNQMQQDRLLTLHRGRIDIPSVEHLLM